MTINGQAEQIVWDIADMIILKILAAPFVLVLTLIVASVSFL